MDSQKKMNQLDEIETHLISYQIQVKNCTGQNEHGRKKCNQKYPNNVSVFHGTLPKFHDEYSFEKFSLFNHLIKCV